MKQSWVEELGSSQSSCTRQKVLVKQRGGLMRLLSGWDLMINNNYYFKQLLPKIIVFSFTPKLENWRALHDVSETKQP